MPVEASAHQPTIGLLLEQTLGHVTHGRNLRRTMSDTDDAQLSFCDLDYEPQSRLATVPLLSNWTLRAGLAARRAVRDLQSRGRLDGLFVHTHVPATFLGATMDRVPTIVSMDATPKQIDRLGRSYEHDVHHPLIESAKYRLHSECFQRAAGLVTWSKWAADSLVADYGVDRNGIEVIPPGVVPSQWRRTEPRHPSRVVRVLFVGGDFKRKGGTLLLEAVERLRNDTDVIAEGLTIELHLVTKADIPTTRDTFVHRALTPNSPELIELFHRCDVFALPTFGDCTPVVLAEAAASGLPAIATDVGAIRESVIDGETGYIVDHDAMTIMAALKRLIVDPTHRLAMGDSATRHAAANMDSEKNALRLLDGLVAMARPPERDRRVVLTVSGNVPPEIDESIDAGIKPVADFVAISRLSGATLLDWSRLREEASFTTGLVRRFAGNSVGLAHHLHINRDRFDVVITDGEQVGIPLAALARTTGGRPYRHIMIAHRLSPAKKQLPVRLLGLGRHVDNVLVYSSHQWEVARRLFSGPDQRVERIDFMVDTNFFRSSRPREMRTSHRRPVICAAGREFRDYPTLIEAARGLDADVIIASASPWSKRSDNARSADLPDNVTVTSFTHMELRAQLDESDLLVLPLQATDFQAGITTILEAMSMGRPVVCTSTDGQNDVIIEGETGYYVPPGDPDALRAAIIRLLENPDEAIAMGKRGRELVEDRADVFRYAERFAALVKHHLVH